jgi:hypothetical protein
MLNDLSQYEHRRWLMKIADDSDYFDHFAFGMHVARPSRISSWIYSLLWLRSRFGSRNS